MVCCCPSSKDKDNEKQKKPKKSKNNEAPGKQTISGRGIEDMDEDTRAVAQWRKKRSGETRDIPHEQNPSFDRQRERMQERTSFDRDSKNTNNVNSQQQTQNLQPNDIEKLETNETPSPPSTVVSTPDASPPRESATDQTGVDEQKKSQQPSSSADSTTSSQQLPLKKQRTGGTTNIKGFKEVGGLMIPQSTQGVPKTALNSANDEAQFKQLKDDWKGRKIDSDDRLSDVPSDIDSVTRDRYLLACQMLKTTLIEKDKALVPIEREFLLSLLGDYEADDGSAMSEDRLSAIETATLRLDQDPLFQSISVKASPKDDQSMLTTSTMGDAQQQSQNQFPKHQHTATKPPKKFNVALPCQPCIPEDAGVDQSVEVTQNDRIVLILPDEGGENDKENGGNANELVRFDGWSFHQSTEHPFKILGADDVKSVQPRVLTPAIMEALRGFFPYSVSESNFWLKFSLARDGASLTSLLNKVRASPYTVIGVETKYGDVFGSFTGMPWRIGTKWFGTGEAFLWRLKKSRYTSAALSIQSDFDNEMEVYPYTGYDDLVQYCTSKTIAVGGGDFMDLPCPFPDEPKGIGFMIDGDLIGGETNSCATFANPRLSKRVSTSNEFAISNLEVWTLTPCLTVAEAEKLELQKLFVEQNRR